MPPDWPRSVPWIAALGRQLDDSGNEVKDVPFAATVLRNAGLLAVVLAHGFRRLFPPY